jgi:hypothetical protein
MEDSTALTPDLQPGTVAWHDLGLTVKVIGPPRIALPVPRLRIIVLDPGPTGLAHGQHATVRADHLTPV